MESIHPSILTGGAILTGPSADGAAGQLLVTDGAGTLGFSSAITVSASAITLNRNVDAGGRDLTGLRFFQLDNGAAIARSGGDLLLVPGSGGAIGFSGSADLRGNPITDVAAIDGGGARVAMGDGIDSLPAATASGHAVRFDEFDLLSDDVATVTSDLGELATDFADHSSRHEQGGADELSLAAAQIVSGTFADARISQSSVTQHQSALTLTESQISDLGDYATQSMLASHEADTTNPHNVTAAQVGAAEQSETVTQTMHGTDDEAARPSGFAAVLWVGSAEPTNAADGDVWIDTSE